MFLRRGRDRGRWRAYCNGLLSLRLLPGVVGRAGQRLFALAAGSGSRYQGRGSYRQLPEDRKECAQVVHSLRRPSADRAPSMGCDRRLRCHSFQPRLSTGTSCELRNHGAAPERWATEAERSADGNGRIGNLSCGLDASVKARAATSWKSAGRYSPPSVRCGHSSAVSDR